MATRPDLPDQVSRLNEARGPGDQARTDDVAGSRLSAGEQQAVDGWPGLLAAAAVGPFFSVERLDGETSWLPLSQFADHPDGLAARVTAALESRLLQELRRTPPHGEGIRVAASVAFLGLAARFVSPALGSLLGSGIVPILSWDHLFWRPATTGILPLAAGPVEGRTAVPDAVALLCEIVIDPTLALGVVVAERFGLSGQVVRGNVASAIAGAAAAVARSGRCTESAAFRLAAALLDETGLTGSGSFAVPDGQRQRFRRNNCCLLYRAGGGLCGDCVLARDGR